MKKQSSINTEWSPISSVNRIDYIDLIRGIAVFGILIANLRWFSLYVPGKQGLFVYPEIDKTVWLLQNIFIEGKFYSIFSLLFGWGIAIQIKRSKTADIATAKFIRRRLGFMLLLGGFHLFFLWEGDIVFLYGLVGFVLLAMRKLSNKTLLLTGIGLLLSPALLYLFKMHLPWLNWPSDVLGKLGEQIYQLFGFVNQDASRNDALRTSSLINLLRINWGDVPYRFSYLFFVSRIPKVLGAMLVGLVIGRTEFYPNLMKHKNKLIWVSILGLLVFIPLNYVLFHFLENSDAYYALQPAGLYYSMVYALTVFPLALVYMITFALLFENKRIHKLLKPILAIGKMAFTNYIMHSLIGIAIFYGLGFGLMEQFGPLAWTVLGVLIFTVQILYSNIWLKYFKFGPIEWIWRSLTYGKLQVLRTSV